MSNRLIIILPYFGTLPNYFSKFLTSCKFNKHVDFLIISDNEIPSSGNIKVISSSWEHFVQYIQAKFDFTISLDKPYKLCDFKPAYGYIFDEYIKGYEYWGHCDCDLIWGDLTRTFKYLNGDYDRIGDYGHLSIYKNNPDTVNKYFMHLKSRNAVDFKEVFSNKKNYCFDEFSGMNILLEENNIKTCTERLFDDIIFYTRNFYSRRSYNNIQTSHSTPQYFVYDNGILLRYLLIKGKWHTDESLYLHMQKRKMKDLSDNDMKYAIIPDMFVSINENDPDVFTKDYIRMIKPPCIDFRYWKTICKSKIANYLTILLN